MCLIRSRRIQLICSPSFVFQDICDRVPFIADLKPSGKYVMEDLHHVGGTPAVIKYLLENGLLHGDCLTGVCVGGWVCPVVSVANLVGVSELACV